METVNGILTSGNDCKKKKNNIYIISNKAEIKYKYYMKN